MIAFIKLRNKYSRAENQAETLLFLQFIARITRPITPGMEVHSVQLLLLVSSGHFSYARLSLLTLAKIIAGKYELLAACIH